MGRQAQELDSIVIAPSLSAFLVSGQKVLAGCRAGTAHRTETVKAQPHAQAKGHGPVHNRPVLRGK